MKKIIQMASQKENFKEINLIEETGKRYLENYCNDKFECNLYGLRNPTFYPNLTGFANFSQRQNETHLPSITFKPCETQYFPQPKYFEGYAQFRLPLTSPFTNVIGNPSIQNIMMKENRLEHNYKNRRLISIQGNEGINYYTSTLAKEETAIKKHLINSINNYISEFKRENKYKPELVYQDHNILALKKLKRKLKINYNTITVNGRNLKPPHEDIQQKYHLIKKHFMVPSNKKRNLTIEDSSKRNTMTNLISQKSTSLQRHESSGSFGQTTINFVPKKPHHEQSDLSFMSDENEKKGSHKETILNNTISNRNIMFKCTEEARLLTGFQPIKIKEDAIIRKGKPKLVNPGDIYRKEVSLMQKVNPLVFKRENEKNEFDRQVLEKKKKNKLIYEKIRIVNKKDNME